MKLFLILPILLLTFPRLVTAEPQSIDAVIAVVEEDIITRLDLEAHTDWIRIELEESGRRLPDAETLHRQVLQRMILDSVLLQQAKNRGIRITEGQLNQTIKRIAGDNEMNLIEFRKLLISKGYDYERYRASVRKELIVNALQRQYTAHSITVSDQEVDDFLKRNSADSTQYEYKLAHILVALPDAATPAQVVAAKEQIEDILQQLDQGADFERLANTYSTDASALYGGDLGWRKQAEIPSLFSAAILTMRPGEHAGPFRSASGYHIAYLSDLRDAEKVLSRQTRSRHILLKTDQLVTEEVIQKQLEDIRQWILDGADFGDLARRHSVDYSSAINGGDIGWNRPGDTVKEYEEVAEQLNPGEMSEPFKSPFGWHLLEVTDRRVVDETEDHRREKIRRQLLWEKRREAFTVWQQRLRDEAYVVIQDGS